MAHFALAFAKIVSTPTQISWSQAYNAGNFFAVLSLEKYGDSELEESLGQIGRQFLETLEQEFFALEEKTNENIKHVISVCLQKAPENIKISFAAAFIPPQQTSVLYLFLLGSGSIDIKRGNNFGALLQKREDDKQLQTASGYLEKNDIIVLQTQQFGTILPPQQLRKLLTDEASETAEIITPLVHGKDNGGASALLLSYHPPTTLPEIEDETLESIVQNENEPTIKNQHEKFDRRKLHLPLFIRIRLNRIKNLKLPKISRTMFRKKQLVIIIIAIFLISFFLISIFHALKNQQNNKENALFQSLYPPVEKKYEEGKALTSLNTNLARVDFIDAQKMTAQDLGKFAPGSPERSKLAALDQKINSAIQSISGTNTVTLNQADSSGNQLLSLFQKNPQYLSIAQDEKTLFALSKTDVTSIDKATGKTKKIILNSGDWTNAIDIATYLGNIYILDQGKNQLLKYSATDNGYAKNTYFSSPASPDLSRAKALAIDGSVYILFPDSIQKYTKGQIAAFTLSGLNQPFTSASQIYTSATSDNIYILDADNTRVLSFDKNGHYQKSYNSKTLKNAAEFTIDESQKRCYVLLDNKIWQFDL